MILLPINNLPTCTTKTECLVELIIVLILWLMLLPCVIAVISMSIKELIKLYKKIFKHDTWNYWD